MYRSVPLKIIISVLFLVLVSFCSAQHVEIRQAAYSGLFFYRGNAATTTSIILRADDLGYHNPTSYGKKSSFSYATESQAQWVSKRRNIFGLGLGFEQLTSKTVIAEDPVLRSFGLPFQTGTVNLKSANLTVNPFAGHRFLAHNIVFDALVGVECAFNLHTNENVHVEAPLKAEYQIKKQDHPTDLRPRMQVNALYNRVSMSVGYSIGTRNLYRSNIPGYGNKKAYSNFIRLGAAYRLK